MLVFSQLKYTACREGILPLLHQCGLRNPSLIPFPPFCLFAFFAFTKTIVAKLFHCHKEKNPVKNFLRAMDRNNFLYVYTRTHRSSTQTHSILVNFMENVDIPLGMMPKFPCACIASCYSILLPLFMQIKYPLHTPVYICIQTKSSQQHIKHHPVIRLAVKHIHDSVEILSRC